MQSWMPAQRNPFVGLYCHLSGHLRVLFRMARPEVAFGNYTFECWQGTMLSPQRKDIAVIFAHVD